MRPSSRAALLAAAFCSFAPATLADDPQSGFVLSELPYPGASATATLANGDIVAFDGLNVDVYDANGDILQNLTSFPSFVFPSFVVVDPDESFAVVGESSNGDLFRVELSPGGPNPIVNLPLSYDAVFEDADTLIVSAAACGFACGNEIYRVDVSTGNAVLLCRVPGASGPIALDGDGNLYYGTVTDQFPPPPNASDVLRWDAAELTGSPVLDETDASLIATALEGASGLAFDPAGGGLYMTVSNFTTGVNRVRKILGHSATPAILVEGTPFQTMANLEFVPGDGAAAFAGYQPLSGGRLRYNTTDFVNVFERRALAPRRPRLTISGAGTQGPGLFHVRVLDGPPGGKAILYFGPSTLYDTNETVLNLGVPLFIGLDLGTLTRLPGRLTLDESGTVIQSYFNPGGLEGQFAIQALLFAPGNVPVGMSTAAFL